MNFVGNIRQERLSQIKIGKITLTDSVPDDDNDIGLLLNLLVPLSKAPTAWFKYTAVKAPGYKKLKVLVISDSYFDLVQKKIASELFSENDFWYYNSSHKNPDDPTSNGKQVDKSGLLEKLKQ